MNLSKFFFLWLLAIPLAHSHGQALSERHPEYVLQRGDVLDIRYRYTPEYDQGVTVRPDERATLLNLGTIVTSGMTVSQFEERVLQLSRARLVDPEITVFLKEFDKPHVFVEGEVNAPGRVEIRSDISVLEAIALAGGFKSTSSKSKVLLSHRVGPENETRTVVLDLKKLIDDKRLNEAAMVHSGDVVYVTQNGLSKLERILHMGEFGAIYNPIP
jgi:polysaccharide export outer membrane protein